MENQKTNRIVDLFLAALFVLTASVLRAAAF